MPYVFLENSIQFLCILKNIKELFQLYSFQLGRIHMRKQIKENRSFSLFPLLIVQQILIFFFLNPWFLKYFVLLRLNVVEMFDVLRTPFVSHPVILYVIFIWMKCVSADFEMFVFARIHSLLVNSLDISLCTSRSYVGPWQFGDHFIRFTLQAVQIMRCFLWFTLKDLWKFIQSWTAKWIEFV